MTRFLKAHQSSKNPVGSTGFFFASASYGRTAAAQLKLVEFGAGHAYIIPALGRRGGKRQNMVFLI